MSQNAISIQTLFTDSQLIDQTVTLQGWVRTRRDSKAGFSFIQVSDGSHFDLIQVVAPNTLENYEQDVLKLTAGCSVSITGKLVASQGGGQTVEVQADTVNVIGWVDDPETYPISPKRHTLEYLREVAHLRPRTNIIGAVTRVRHHLAMAIHRFFDEKGYVWINTPIITASDCEGAGELFRVSTLNMVNAPRDDRGAIDFKEDFFGRESFLTVSGQLNAEAYCLAMSKVYTFGPTFRAENSNTARHLSEFWMVEPEIAFADLQDVVCLAHELLVYVCQAVLDNCRVDLEFFTKRVDETCLPRLEAFVKSDLKQVDYSDAIDILEKSDKKFEYPVSWGVDLQTEHERYLTDEVFKSPVAVVNYPKDIKAFYMRANDDDKTVAAMDLLVPGVGELMGGAQREDRIEKLDARLHEMNLNPEHFTWYRDLRRYGSVPHGGFGMGFERLIAYVTGVANVRDVIPFPRTPGSVEF